MALNISAIDGLRYSIMDEDQYWPEINQIENSKGIILIPKQLEEL